MTVNISLFAGVGAQFFDGSGNVLTGGKIYSYAAGTTTPQTTYTTSAGNVAQSNPIVLDASGRVSGSGEIWLTDALLYKFVVTDANDVLIGTYDNIPGNGSGILASLSGPNGSSLVGFIQPFSGAVASTVQTELRCIQITPQQFGAVGDGVTDDTTAIENAVAAVFASTEPAVLVGYGTYKITSTVNFRQILVDFDRASIDVAHAGIGVTIGGNASNPNNPTQRFNSITRSVGTDSTTTPTVRALGVKGQYIYLNRTTYFQVYADTHNVGEDALRDLDYSSAYSNFWLKYVETIELTNNLANAGGPNNSAPGGSTQWVNENQFYLNRSNTLLINGTYVHNHNKFYDGTFENTATINWDTARDTFLYNARFEAGPTNITFGVSSARNVIEKTWTSSENNGSIFDPIVSGTIIDSGVQNQVYDYRGQQYSKAIVASVSVADTVINNIVSPGTRLAFLQRIFSTNGTPCVSEYIPLVSGDQYFFYASGGNSGDNIQGYRPRIGFFDKNLQPVTPSADWVSSPNISSVLGNVLTLGVGVDNATARITDNGVAAGAAYIIVSWFSANSESAKALARNLTITHATKSSTSNLPNPVPAFYAAKLPVVSAIPTQGFAPLGYTAVDSDGISLYINTFALDTTLTSAAVSGATSINVTSGTGTVNGDIIGINIDNRNTDWTTIASGGGTTSITLTDALTADAASGSRVVFNRWVTK